MGLVWFAVSIVLLSRKVFLCVVLQALNQELLRVSTRLESVEEQLWTITTEELEKERDLLRKKRSTLDAQLNENQVLNVQVKAFCYCCCCYCYSKVLPFINYCCVFSCRKNIPSSSWMKLLKLWMQLWSLKTTASRKRRRSC